MTSFGTLGKDRSGRTIFAKLFGRTPVIDESLQGEDPEIINLLEEHELTHGYHDPRDWNTSPGEAACRLRVLAKAIGRKKPLPEPKTTMGREVIEDIEGFEKAYRKAGGKYPIYDDYAANLAAATRVVIEAKGESGRGRKEAK